MKTPWAPPFNRQGSFVVLKMTCVGPVPAPAELQTNPAGTLETLVLTTVNPAGTLSATQPIGWMPSVTVTVTFVGTPSVSVMGESAIDQYVAALTGAGLPGSAAAANQSSASARATTVARLPAIRRPADPAI
jgi:hypothetical protein